MTLLVGVAALVAVVELSAGIVGPEPAVMGDYLKTSLGLKIALMEPLERWVA
jgi:hypothetical protein